MLQFTCLLLIVMLMLQVSRACGGNNDEQELAAARQQSDEYFANAFGYTSSNPWDSAYYQSSAPGKLENDFIIYLCKYFEIIKRAFTKCSLTFLSFLFLEYFSSLQSRSPIIRSRVHPFNKYFVTSK